MLSASISRSSPSRVHNSLTIEPEHFRVWIPILPLASVQNGLGYTLLPYSSTHQRELVCGVCIGTTQVGPSLPEPLNSLFKRSSLRSLRDPLICECLTGHCLSSFAYHPLKYAYLTVWHPAPCQNEGGGKTKKNKKLCDVNADPDRHWQWHQYDNPSHYILWLLLLAWTWIYV